MAKKITTETRIGTRETQLESLAMLLAKRLDKPEEKDNIAQLAKQYRDTLAELEEVRKERAPDDEIGEILSSRETAGKSGAVRKDRSKIYS